MIFVLRTGYEYTQFSHLVHLSFISNFILPACECRDIKQLFNKRECKMDVSNNTLQDSKLIFKIHNLKIQTTSPSTITASLFSSYLKYFVPS